MLITILIKYVISKKKNKKIEKNVNKHVPIVKNIHTHRTLPPSVSSYSTLTMDAYSLATDMIIPNEYPSHQARYDELKSSIESLSGTLDYWTNKWVDYGKTQYDTFSAFHKLYVFMSVACDDMYLLGKPFARTVDAHYNLWMDVFEGWAELKDSERSDIDYLYEDLTTYFEWSESDQTFDTFVHQL